MACARATDRSHVLATPEALERDGIEVFETGRGGDVTFTAPDSSSDIPSSILRPDRQDVHRYVRDLEEVMIRMAADFGVQATRQPGLTGAWVDTPRPGAAALGEAGGIGVRISRWITSHGFAFNVNTDLDHSA